MLLELVINYYRGHIKEVCDLITMSCVLENVHFAVLIVMYIQYDEICNLYNVDDAIVAYLR